MAHTDVSLVGHDLFELYKQYRSSIHNLIELVEKTFTIFGLNPEDVWILR